MNPDFQKLLSRKNALLTDHMLITAWNDRTRFTKLTGLSEYVRNLEIIDGDFYFDSNWMDKITGKYKNKDPKVFINFINTGYKHGEKIKNFARKLKINTAKEKEFWVSIELLKNLLVFLPVTHPLAKAIEGHVVNILKKKVNEENITEALLEISAPEKLNGPGLEIEDLKKIKKKSIKNKKLDVNKEIKKHAEKYSYLGYREPFSKVYSEEFFKNRLEELKVEQKPKPKYNIKFSKDELKYVKLLKEFVYFRNYRTEKMYEALYYLEPLWKKLAKQHGLGDQDLGYYLIDEIKRLFENKVKVDNNVVEERKKGHAFLLHNDKISLIIGDALRIKKQLTNKFEITQEMKGMVACKGKVSGKVKIVLKASEQNKISEGDILVTYMTTPDFLPSMKKAAAFVTDEGGITCHAAIVAREMDKPCIIGTKNATKVLKDGDMVEVDANRGVVRKL